MARTGQPGQVSLSGHPGWVSLDRTERTGLPGHDSHIKRAVDKGVWAEKLEKDSWYMTAWTGKPGQDSRDRTARTGKSGQASQKDRWDSTARKGNRGGVARI
jgi:hypothetical protein